ncbi:hypothetical protein F53441_11045 [Fusarium austroafricanum]|uniref:Uncharacterized protein n=1 Tax=Fusarium austroafricanum TaxID=2364996 RepID=A0A8H4K4Y3_9HYPO|nr:hypothetical protein F53441_11045 [Fusarium austroafricanum]
MFWHKRLDYDPKEFPNYRILFPEPETGFERIIKQWPIVFHFIGFTFKFLISILSIIFQWCCMIVRNPFQYRKHNAWIIGKYQASPTGAHMAWGIFITSWFFHFAYRLSVAAWEVVLGAYDDPFWALYSTWDFFILSAIFNLAEFFLVTVFKMSTYSLASLIALLIAVAMWQLHYCFFVYTPEEVLEGSQFLTNYSLANQSPKNQPLISEAHITPDRPGRCFRVPTPSTGSSASSSRSSPDTTHLHLRPRKSNKPPGAAYVQVSPQAIQKLHDEGIFIPEPTRETDYSYIQPINPKRLTNFSRFDTKIRSQRLREAERKRGIVIESPEPQYDDTPSPTVPTKTQWVFSAIESVQRKLRWIEQDITEIKMQVNAFSEASNVRPLPATSRALPGSPQTQQRNATLEEKDRIRAAITDYPPKIESLAYNVLRQQRGMEEALTRIDRLIANAGDVTSRAIHMEVKDVNSRANSMFNRARQAQISSRDIEELCKDHRRKLEADAVKLRRMERTHVKHIRVRFNDEVYA